MALTNYEVEAGARLARQRDNQSGLKTGFEALVVSANLEHRQTIIRNLESLSIGVVSCSTLSQAEEALSKLPPELIFCDEELPDGAYSDLLKEKASGRKTPHVIVMTRTGEWDLYMEATRRGAFDVIRSPWHPTDIEMTVIRAAHETDQRAFAA
jgi:DNA-binding NtrC family response regulator